MCLKCPSTFLHLYHQGMLLLQRVNSLYISLKLQVLISLTSVVIFFNATLFLQHLIKFSLCHWNSWNPGFDFFHFCFNICPYCSFPAIFTFIVNKFHIFSVCTFTFELLNLDLIVILFKSHFWRCMMWKQNVKCINIGLSAFLACLSLQHALTFLSFLVYFLLKKVVSVWVQIGLKESCSLPKKLTQPELIPVPVAWSEGNRNRLRLHGPLRIGWWIG